MINRFCYLVFILFSSLLNAQSDKGMEEFQNYLTRNIKINKNLEVKQRNSYLSQIVCGNKTYYFDTKIGHPDCNGTFCIEQNWSIFNQELTDSNYFWSWGFMGFFSDVNNDKQLDFINIIETNKHIYQEDTFKVIIQTIVGDSLGLENLKDKKGKEYFISIYWKGGLFGDNSNREPVKIIDQHWPFYVKF